MGTGKPRIKQRSVKRPKSLVLSGASPPPLANCPPNVSDDIAPLMVSSKVFSMVVAAPVESALIGPVNPISSSPSLRSSKDAEPARDSTDQFAAFVLLKLSSLSIQGSSSHPDLRTGMARDYPGQCPCSASDQADQSGSHVASSVPGSSDLDLDIQCLEAKGVECQKLSN